MQKEKLIIVFTVLVDVIGFGIVIPILPFYVSSFGASPFTVTLIFSAFGFFAFLSSPYLGALSDKVGRRPILLVSILSTAIGWFVFAAANSIPLLFLGRIIGGAAAGNYTVAQSCLVDLSKDEKERATNLGLIGASFGIGFIVGPLVGGSLSTISHSFPFWFAGLLAMLNTTAAFFFLPETHHKRDAAMPVSVNPLAPLGRALLSKELHPLFILWIFFGLSFFSTQSVVALYAEAAFRFDAFATSMMFLVIGVVTALNQAVLMKHFWLRYFSLSRLEFLMIILLTAGFVLMAIPSLWLFALATIIIASSQSVFRVVVITHATELTPPHRKGEVIGIMTSLLAACMVIAPASAGMLFEVSLSLPFIAAAILMALSVFLESRRRMPARPQSLSS